jgi:predicted alpha/beta-hydrolase family hydrolase
LTWTIAVGSDTTSAEYDPALGNQRGILVCAHGAGGNMKDRATVAAANAMRAIGLGVVRFNFLYKEKGSGGPDRMPTLMECFTAVVHRTRELRPERLIIGGRSMGGRVASMMAADGFDAAGLLLLAYPLHPPNHRSSSTSCATGTCRASPCRRFASTGRATSSAAATSWKRRCHA